MWIYLHPLPCLILSQKITEHYNIVDVNIHYIEDKVT